MKKILLPMLAILLFAACQKQLPAENTPATGIREVMGTDTYPPDNKIDVCHREGNGSWHTITVDSNALPAHLEHGDIVPDADGDGYTKTTPCGTGGQDDCDDNNAVINPNATEVCGNNIDDNCNGEVDEGCTTVKICDQTWMVKNLDVDIYRDGTTIPQVQNPSEWSSLTTGAWCYYNNNPDNGAIYGKLYNWYAVAGIWNEESKTNPELRKQLAPEGWHISTNGEWGILETCLGGPLVSGAKIRSTGTVEANTGLWYQPNTGASNSSGFTGLPGGIRSWYGGSFFSIGLFGEWWTTAEEPFGYATYHYVNNAAENLWWGGNDKRCGLSVRCVRD